MAGTPCSQRFACKILGLRRNTARYRPLRLARYAPLEASLREIYAHHPQLGHRKAKAILNRRLRQEGRPLVGLRLVRRLRRRLCLCVPPPKRKRVRKGLTTGRVPTKAAHARHVWTWDFVADITTVGGTFRILAIIDEHTKECVGHHVARSINAEDVMRSLARAISEHGAPGHIRSDNGSEFIARVVRDGLALRGIKTLYIDPGSPWQNGFIESFNACARRELLDREQFYTLSEARVVFAGWIDDYNAYRPHGAIGYLTPDELMGGTPGLRPSVLTLEAPQTTLPEATQL
jgi:transposase InsO family protein